MKYTILLPIFALIFISSCSVSSPFVIGSNYDPTFDVQNLDNMAIAYFYLDDSDARFWDHRTNRGKNPAGVENLLFREMRELLNAEDITTHDLRLETNSQEWGELSGESEAIKQYLKDLDTVGSKIFGFTSDYDYASIVEEVGSRYVLSMTVDPYSIESESSGPVMSPDGTMMMAGGGSAITYEYGIFAYIVDVESNKVVWVFNNYEYVNLYKFDNEVPQKTALAALFTGRDLKYKSFDLITEKKVKIVEKSGETYYGKVISIDGLSLEIETDESLFERDIREIEEITQMVIKSLTARNRQTVEETLYPQYLK